MLSCIQGRKFNKYDASKVFRLHTETFLNVKDKKKKNALPFVLNSLLVFSGTVWFNQYCQVDRKAWLCTGIHKSCSSLITSYITIAWRCLKHIMISKGTGGLKWLPSRRRYLSLGAPFSSCMLWELVGQISVPFISAKTSKCVILWKIFCGTIQKSKWSTYSQCYCCWGEVAPAQSWTGEQCSACYGPNANPTVSSRWTPSLEGLCH